jgi:tellurite resistance protein TerC
MPFAATETSQHLHLVIHWWSWLLLSLWFTIFICLDIFVIHRKEVEVTLRSAVKQSLAWVGLGVLLGGIIWATYGHEAGSQYYSGYLIEKSLSIDNVFTWSIIMSYFAVPRRYQHRVLFWGILGAIVLRIIFVFIGIAVLDKFEPLLIMFGLILIYSGYRLLKAKHGHEFNPGDSKLFKFVKRYVPIAHHIEGHKLFVTENGIRVATGLFLALLIITISDVIFALDSVPAILAISREPFIVISSNAAAILGMRALYFLFEFIKDRFWLLNHALGVLMLFVGIKMLTAPDKILGQPWLGLHIPTNVSLIFIVLILLVGILSSLLLEKPRKQ